jgi:hypothetical protein
MFTKLAIAATDTPDTTGTDTTTIHNLPMVDAGTVFSNGLNIMYFLLGAIAVIIIIVAGIMYATSAGDSGRVTKAKNALTYAIIGLVVVLLAFTITQFITGRF